MTRRSGGRLFAAIAFLLACARTLGSGPVAGAPLTLQPCKSGAADQTLRVDVAASTVTSADGSLCVTYGGPFPAPQTMQPCVPGNVNQTIVYDSSDYAFKLPRVDDCVAWNQETGQRVISSYTCSSIAWNGWYTPFAGGLIVANCSTPDTCDSSLCVTASPLPTCPSAACNSDIDCNLNGVCSANGTCTCFKPWGGVSCGELKFLPLTAPASTNGFPGASPNETTWGGNAILYDGIYHLFVAEMVNECSLAQWGSNSQCAHAISSSPEGPYTKTDVAVGVWCE